MEVQALKIANMSMMLHRITRFTAEYGEVPNSPGNTKWVKLTLWDVGGERFTMDIFVEAELAELAEGPLGPLVAAVEGTKALAKTERMAAAGISRCDGHNCHLPNVSCTLGEDNWDDTSAEPDAVSEAEPEFDTD